MSTARDDASEAATGLPDIVPEILRLREGGESLVVVTLVRAEGLPTYPGARMVVSGSGERAGSLHPALDAPLVEEANRVLREKRSRLRSYRRGETGLEDVGVRGGDVDVYFEVLARRPSLVVVGAGHIAQPLAAVAKLLEFEVTVVDDRPEYASRERFPQADHVLLGPYRERLAALPLHSDSYLVLVTRGHVHDAAALEEVLDSEAAYIGMIGSKRRVRAVLESMARAGRDRERLIRVHAPVGIDIGADTPAEIAIAIMAEIINLRRGGHAPSLSLGERLNV